MTASDDTPAPWLSIIGIGEDGLDGLSVAARERLARAKLIAGGRRHLALVASLGKPTFEWETPFAASIPKLLTHRGRRVAVLCSGDPFWYGAGAVLAEAVAPEETMVLPAPSTFAWAAARLRWRLEETTTLGLHARPIELLRPRLRTGARLIVLARDGAAPAQIASYLNSAGFGPSRLTILEALGGPQERIRVATAASFALDDVKSPVALAIEAVAEPNAAIIPRVAGLPDELFIHDGQLTKREIRAVTMSTLAPRGGELLWDVGAGSGAIGIEWLLAHPNQPRHRHRGARGSAQQRAR
jgi:precorrin-6Y C5,15-methyltransferase (decarboxylating)